MRDYQFIDYATQAYALLVGLLILGFHNETVRAWPWLVAAHGLVLVLVHWLIRASARGQGGAVVAFLRAFYPILLYTGFYRETGELNEMFVRGNLDVIFIRWDQALFGYQPSLEWMLAWPQRWVGEFFFASYFSYYFMIVGVGLALLLRDRAQFAHYVTVISFIFYCCYLNYIFLPVMGPRIYFTPEAALFPADVHLADPPGVPPTIQAGLFYRIVIFLYHYFESDGAAFPSSHVAIALATAWFSWRYLPRIRYLHAFMALSLCCSTVYCRYHYVVDVIAGVLTTLVLLPIGEALYRRLGPTARENDAPRVPARHSSFDP